MSTPTFPAKTAAEAAAKRFPDDPDAMPSDEFFLQKFRSQIKPRPSEEFSDHLHYSGMTIEEARAEEKARFLESAKTQWRERREAEKLAASQAEKRQQFQRDIEAGLYRRKLTELLDAYRALASQQQEIEHTLADAKREEERISTGVSDLTELKKTLAESRDLIAAAQVRVTQLARQQTALVAPLRATYTSAKAEFAFYHNQLVKQQPTKTLVIDKAAGFYGIGLGNYAWPDESFDCNIEHFTGAQIVSAALKLEQRFAVLESFNPAAKRNH